MKYVMKNFEKIKLNKSNIGPKVKRDDWKRDRSDARRTKKLLQRVA